MKIVDFLELCRTNDVEALGNALVPANEANVGDVVICGGCYAIVLFIQYYAAPQQTGHIKPTYNAYQLVTTNGSRWYGKLELDNS